MIFQRSLIVAGLALLSGFLIVQDMFSQPEALDGSEPRQSREAQRKAAREKKNAHLQQLENQGYRSDAA